MDDKIVKSEKGMKQIFEIVYELEKLEKIEYYLEILVNMPPYFEAFF